MRRLAGLVLGLVLGGSAWAVAFDSGSSEYIDMGYVPEHALTTAHSVTAIAIGDPDAAPDAVIAAMEGIDDITWRLQDQVTDKWQAFGSNSGVASDGYLLASTSTVTGDFQALTWTFDSSSEAHLFVDSELEVTDSVVLETDTCGNCKTGIGAFWTGSVWQDFSDGEVATAWIHDAQITADAALEEATTCLPSRDPVSHWPLLECGYGNPCSGTAYDETEVAHGTYTNTPTGGETPCKTIR